MVHYSQNLGVLLLAEFNHRMVFFPCHAKTATFSSLYCYLKYVIGILLLANAVQFSDYYLVAFQSLRVYN